MTLRDRLLRHADVPGEAACWQWRGAKVSTSGQRRGIYGRIGVRQSNGQMVMKTAHRAAYEAFRGPIPESAHVLHTCDNKLCVNPAHLYAGTNADNVRDRIERGRNRNSHPTLGSAKAAEIRRLHSEGMTNVQIARAYGLSQSMVCDVIKGRRYAVVA